MQMKILLINPVIREWAKPNVLPLGLAYIAAVLQDNGHAVEVMDLNALRLEPSEIESRIRENDYDLAGIGAIVTVYREVKKLIELLKTCHPNRKVMVGGSVGTSIPHIIMEKTATDIVCIGEGEVTALEIVSALEKGRTLDTVAGIWFKQGGGDIVKNPPRKPIKDMNTIPLPAWDLFPMDVYLANPVGAPNRNKWVDGESGEEFVRSMNVSATRGCPYKCIYCYHDFMGQGYRFRSPRSILNEIGILHEKYGVEYIHFMDDEFCMRKGFVTEFCKLFKEHYKGKINWGCAGRVNLMTEELIRTMADSGCVMIGYGIESGSQKMLDVMKKGVTVDQAKRAIRWTQKYTDWPACSFMVGTPGETRETIQETVDFCRELDLAPEVIFFMTAYPGTELYATARAAGKIPYEEAYILDLGEQGEKIRINFTDMSDDELYRVQEEMIAELKAWNKLKHPESK